MIHYDRIHISHIIEVDKGSASKVCIICHYWCFLDIGFRFNTLFEMAVMILRIMLF